jgi:chemotaxis-related protein WspD
VSHSDSPTPVIPDAPAPAGACPHDELQPAACWNQVGVYGDGSCPELLRLVHCRNCPVYAAAGTQLLNRPLPPGYRHEQTRHFAVEKKLGEPAKTSGVIFRLRAEWLALPTQAFQEVAERRPIHSLPHRRRGIVLGLANIRGELLICVSLGHLLGLEPAGFLEALRSEYHRLLVVNWQGNRLAFPVDEVHGPHRFHLQELEQPPAALAKPNPAFTRGVLRWQRRGVGLLDADSLFTTLNRSLT